MNYARAIRMVRAVKNLSQKDLAALVGVDTSYLSMIEAGRRRPSGRVVESIAKATKVPVHLLTLLASETQDLKNVSGVQAQALGQQLLELLVATEEETAGG